MPRPLEVGHIPVTSEDRIVNSPRSVPSPEVGVRWGAPARFVFSVEDPQDEDFNIGVSVNLTQDDPVRKNINFLVNMDVQGYFTKHRFMDVRDVRDITENTEGTDAFRRIRGIALSKETELRFNPGRVVFGWDELQPKKSINQFRQQFKRFRYNLTFLARPETSFKYDMFGTKNQTDGVTTGAITQAVYWSPETVSGKCLDIPPDQDETESCISPGGMGAAIPFNYQFADYGGIGFDAIPKPDPEAS